MSEALCRLGPACLTCQVSTPCLRSPDSSQKPPVAPSTCQTHPFLTGVSGPWKGAHCPWNRLGQGVGEYTQWNLVLSLKTMVLLLIKATIQGQIIKLKRPVPTTLLWAWLRNTGGKIVSLIFLGSHIILSASSICTALIIFQYFTFFFWFKLYFEVLHIHPEEYANHIYRTG